MRRSLPRGGCACPGSGRTSFFVTPAFAGMTIMTGFVHMPRPTKKGGSSDPPLDFPQRQAYMLRRYSPPTSYSAWLIWPRLLYFTASSSDSKMFLRSRAVRCRFFRLSGP